MPNPNTETNETNNPNLNPGTPNEDQNLSSGESGTEVNPGETGNATEVDLDPQKTNTYEGDDGAPNRQ